MRLRASFIGLAAALLLFVGSAAMGHAADATFVGKLALIADPEVAKELALSEETKKKLMEVIDKREQEAIALVSGLKGKPQAQVAAALAPFVAESEKLGKALLDDNQWAKLQKLQIAKDGMIGILLPDMIGRLEITDDQKKEIAPLIEQYHKTMTSGSDFQKRSARTVTERSIAKLLTDAQRGTWEQLSGAPAGGSAVAQSSTPAAPPGPGGSAPSGAGGVNVQRAGGSGDFTVSEDGKFKFDFVFTPWRNVLEYFAKKAGYAFATDKWPQGTFNYSDPRYYTADEALDILNLHLITKGFILAKREKLLRLFDTVNDGPVPPEFVEEISPDDIEKHGKFELVKVYFQLDKWMPSEAAAEIEKTKGPYGSVVVLSASRQLVVTDLGERLRWIKRTIDEVENPKTNKQDQRFEIIKLNRLTPSEFLTNVRALLGIAPDKNETTDGNLRLSSNDLDSLVYCRGTPARIDEVKEFARQMDGGPSAAGRTTAGGITITQADQFTVYEIRRSDPPYAENVVRTLLANKWPSLKIQLDPKTQKLAVWGPPDAHQAVQAILFNLEQNANVTEFIRLRKNGPQETVTSLNQMVGGDPTGKTATNGFLAVADLNNSAVTISGTPRQIDQAKELLWKMGESLEGFSGAPGGRGANVPEDRSNVRVIPLNSRTMNYVVGKIEEVWQNPDIKIRVEKVDSLKRNAVPSDIQARSASEAPTPQPRGMADGQQRGGARPGGKAAPKAAPPPPKPEPKAFPQPKQPALKPDVTLRREATEKEAAEQQAAAEKNREPVYFITDPPVSAGTATVQQPIENAAEKPTEAPPAPLTNDKTNDKAPSAENNAVGPAEILVRVTPAGIVIQGQDLDALDDFQTLLEQLVQLDKKRGRRPETFPIKHKDAEVAANMLKALIEGGATMDNSASLNFAGMMGGPLGMLGGLLGGGGNSNPSGSVNISGTGFDGTIVPDPDLNVLYVTATPESLDFIEPLIKLIDREESPDPQENPPARFIPVLHGKAADVMALVKEQFAGQIFGEQTQRGGQQIQPQDIAMALLTGGRGGPGGGRGGGGGRGNQQTNMGEKKKIKISVATESNSLIVTAPDHLFQDVQEFVAMVDLENVVPNPAVTVVNIKKSNADSMYNTLASMVGANASVVRVLPFNSAQMAGRGGMNPAMMNQQLARGGQGNQQQPGGPQGQLTPQQQQQLMFNQGRGGGNRGGQGNFGQPGFGGGGPGGFAGGNRGGGAPGGFGGGGNPGGFGGQGGRGGGGAPGGFGGGGAPGGFGGGRGGAPGGFGGGGFPGGGGGRGGGPGGGGIQ